MERYDLVDAALDATDRYLTALDIMPDEVVAEVHPTFDIEGNTIQLRLEINLPGEVEIDQEFRGLTEEQGYQTWVEKFVRRFPKATMQYASTTETGTFIDEAVQSVERFRKAFRVTYEDIAIIMEPVYLREQGDWGIEYSVHVETDIGDQTMFQSQPLPDYDVERVRNEAYPLWINQFRDAFGSETLYYAEPEDVDWNP